MKRIHHSHVHEEYNINDVPIIWLTQVRVENCIIPTNITQLSIAVKDFVEKDVEGVIMLEGLEYLIAQNGFEELQPKLCEGTNKILARLEQGYADKKRYEEIVLDLCNEWNFTCDQSTKVLALLLASMALIEEVLKKTVQAPQRYMVMPSSIS